MVVTVAGICWHRTHKIVSPCSLQPSMNAYIGGTSQAPLASIQKHWKAVCKQYVSSMCGLYVGEKRYPPTGYPHANSTDIRQGEELLLEPSRQGTVLSGHPKATELLVGPSGGGMT